MNFPRGIAFEDFETGWFLGFRLPCASFGVRGFEMQEFSLLFEGIEDPRCSNATRHSLHEMLLIALLSVLCGGEGCADMERFGRAKEPFLRRFMVLQHGIPSHDAFSDLFNALGPGGLQKVLLRLLEERSALLEADVIAIDGKSLRRSFATAAARSPVHLVHLVQAFAARARLVLGQVKVDGKSNETVTCVGASGCTPCGLVPDSVLMSVSSQFSDGPQGAVVIGPTMFPLTIFVSKLTSTGACRLHHPYRPPQTILLMTSFHFVASALDAARM